MAVASEKVERSCNYRGKCTAPVCAKACQLENMETKLRDGVRAADEATGLPPELFEEMLGAAHEAFEAETRRWKVQRSSVGGIVVRVMGELDLSEAGAAVTATDEVLFHRFDSFEFAQFFKRDKVLRAALEAALKAMAA